MQVITTPAKFSANSHSDAAKLADEDIEQKYADDQLNQAIELTVGVLLYKLFTALSTVFSTNFQLRTGGRGYTQKDSQNWQWLGEARNRGPGVGYVS